MMTDGIRTWKATRIGVKNGTLHAELCDRRRLTRGHKVKIANGVGYEEQIWVVSVTSGTNLLLERCKA